MGHYFDPTRDITDPIRPDPLQMSKFLTRPDPYELVRKFHELSIPMQRKTVYKPRQITYSAAKLTTIRRTHKQLCLFHILFTHSS